MRDQRRRQQSLAAFARRGQCCGADELERHRLTRPTRRLTEGAPSRIAASWLGRCALVRSGYGANSRRTVGATIVVLLGLASGVVLVGAPAARAATDGHSRLSCKASVASRVRVRVLTPTQGTRISLLHAPEFTVSGTLQGRAASRATSVEFLSAGRRVGRLRLRRSTSRRGMLQHGRPWKLRTAAPPGKVRLIVCVLVGRRPVGSATVGFTVVRPPAGATVVNPAVHRLTSEDLSAIASISSDRLTIAGGDPFHVGQVLVAGVSPRTPRGLLRKVISEDKRGNTTTVMTSNASLTDVFDQAHINVTRPLSLSRPESGGTLRPAIGTSLSLGTWSEPVSAKDGKASLSATLSASAQLVATFNMTLDIRASSTWGIPHPSLSKLFLDVTGSLPASLKLSFSATGKLEKSVPLGEPLSLDPILVDVDPPLWVTPMITTSLNVSTSAGFSDNFGLTLTPSLNEGFDYENGKLSLINHLGNSAKATSPWTPQTGVTATRAPRSPSSPT